MECKFDYSNLRGRVIAKFGSLTRFAEVDGRSLNTISKKFNGKSQISIKDIEKWSSPELLDIPATEYKEYFFCKQSSAI
jgi:hypothetical protein